jgi:bacillithiol biosynthesis cysteine-adding enzyme BshC
VILLDAADADLHAIARPVYEGAVRNASELTAGLLACGKSLHDAGYHEQVKVTASSTLLFALRDGARVPVHRVNGVFSAGDEKLSDTELLQRIAAAPESFSANVLLRPVVQDYLLPTLAYVGGPSEVAYFAQAAVVYERLLGRVTPVLPRLSATLVEPHAKRLLDRYGLSVPDVFRPEEQLREVLAERSLPPGLQQNFENARASLETSLQAITESLAQLDPTLVDAAGRAGAKMQYQLDRLRTRAANAELRRSEVLARHARQLSSSLYPHHGLQERTIAAVYFLVRYPDLLASLAEVTRHTCPEHKVVYL